MSSEAALNHIATGGAIAVTPELLEQLYRGSRAQPAPGRKSSCGNPTPVALIGLFIALSALSCDLMGWRGASTYGAAGIGFYFFYGGLLMILGGVGEFIIGNTFPCLAWSSIGALWLSFAATLQPFYGTYTLYSATGSATEGLNSVGFNSSIAFFFLAVALMFFVYFIGSFRFNLMFVLIFLCLTCAFSMIAGAFWQISNGNGGLATKLLTGAGGFAFAASAFVLWLWVSVVLVVIDFPLSLPVCDLSGLLVSKAQKAQVNADKEHAV